MNDKEFVDELMQSNAQMKRDNAQLLEIVRKMLERNAVPIKFDHTLIYIATLKNDAYILTGEHGWYRWNNFRETTSNELGFSSYENPEVALASASIEMAQLSVYKDRAQAITELAALYASFDSKNNNKK